MSSAWRRPRQGEARVTNLSLGGSGGELGGVGPGAVAEQPIVGERDERRAGPGGHRVDLGGGFLPAAAGEERPEPRREAEGAGDLPDVLLGKLPQEREDDQIDR